MTKQRNECEDDKRVYGSKWKRREQKNEEKLKYKNKTKKYN